MIRFLHLDTARIDGIAGVIGCKVDVGDVPDSSQPMIPSQTSWMTICTHPNPSAADVHWNRFHYSDVALLPGNNGLTTGHSEQCVGCYPTGSFDRQIRNKPLFESVITPWKVRLYFEKKTLRTECSRMCWHKTVITQKGQLGKNIQVLNYYHFETHRGMST